jgi:hypothetical protein
MSNSELRENGALFIGYATVKYEALRMLMLVSFPSFRAA